MEILVVFVVVHVVDTDNATGAWIMRRKSRNVLVIEVKSKNIVEGRMDIFEIFFGAKNVLEG